jgi:hypothetical protein
MTAPPVQFDSSNGPKPKKPNPYEAQFQADSTSPPVASFEDYRKKYGIQAPDAANDFAEYRRKHGTPNNPFEAQFLADSAKANPYEDSYAATQGPDAGGFAGGKGATGTTDTIPLGEGLGRAGVQGLTQGFGDELRAALGTPLRMLTSGKGPIETYMTLRDQERERQRAFEQEHPIISPLAEALGSILTAMAAGPGMAFRSGAAFGGLSGLGHAEGSAGEQAKATGLGAALGGVLAKGASLAGEFGSAVMDRINPERIARRELATVLPENAQAIFDARKNLAPDATVPGELSPKTSALAATLGKSPKTAITEPMNVAQRIQAVKDVRAEVGKGYDALEQPLVVDDQIRALAAKAGQPLPADAETVPFSTIHNLRQDVGAMRAAGRGKHEIGELRQGIADWLSASERVPEILPIDAKYTTLTQHLGNALQSLHASDVGEVAAAKRALGAGTRQGNRMLPSLTSHPIQWMANALEPSPASKAEALQNFAFNPATAEKSLGQALSTRQSILSGPNPFLGRTAATAGGAALAPQLSSDTASAREHAVEMRTAGMTDAQVEQQLGQVYEPGIVRFVIAATPQRLGQ